VLDGGPTPVPPEDAVANLRIIEDDLRDRRAWLGSHAGRADVDAESLEGQRRALDQCRLRIRATMPALRGPSTRPEGSPTHATHPVPP
jgi:hypothetical protein